MPSQPFAPSLSPKGQIVFNWPSSAKQEHPSAPVTALLSGARYSTKTNTVLNCILRHLWETPAANFTCFANAVKVLTDAGPWKQLIEDVLPEWLAGLSGMKILTENRKGVAGPVVDSKTRTVYLEISNFYGGMSKIMLNSIQHPGEIEEKLRSTAYTGIWFSELGQFKDPRVLTDSLFALRARHIEPWQHLFIADVNPTEEGVDFWAYKRWYEKNKTPTKEDLERYGPPNEEVIRSLRLMEFFMEDNPFITEGRKAYLRSMSTLDPLQYQRDVQGLWVKGLKKNKLFADVFDAERHVVGVKDRDNPARGQIKLDPATTNLYGGWDLGGGSNHAAGIVEKRTIIRPGGAVTIFNVIASLRDMSDVAKIADFTKDFMVLQKEIADRYPGKKFNWTHYSDDSSVNQPRGGSGEDFDYQEVLVASNNTITLIGVPAAKKKNMVAARIQLLRKLLHQNRIFFSANCDDVIAMLENATGSADEDIKWGPHKHCFDWLSYVVFSLAYEDVVEAAAGPEPVEATITTVRL